MKKNKITKSDIFTFFGIVASAVVTAILTRIQRKNDLQEAVHDILAEERRQISEAAMAENQEDA